MARFIPSEARRMIEEFQKEEASRKPPVINSADQDEKEFREKLKTRNWTNVEAFFLINQLQKAGYPIRVECGKKHHKIFVNNRLEGLLSMGASSFNENQVHNFRTVIEKVLNCGPNKETR